LARGLGGQRQGHNWRCPCPLDCGYSLSFRDAEEGRLLIHCFGGCNYEDVLAALVEYGLFDDGIDPAFDCAHPSGTLDSVSFLFRERGVGAITDSLAARRGPDFGLTIGGNVSGRLSRDDDRYVGYELDGGVVDVGSGGSVGGTLHFDVGNIVVDGPFGAPHCAALDVVVPG